MEIAIAAHAKRRNIKRNAPLATQTHVHTSVDEQLLLAPTRRDKQEQTLLSYSTEGLQCHRTGSKSIILLYKQGISVRCMSVCPLHGAETVCQINFFQTWQVCCP